MADRKHWFPLNHDFNSDHELWELTEKVGDRSLRIWEEFLSIADRNNGFLPVMSESFMRTVAHKCRTIPTKVRQVSDHARTCVWLVCDQCPTDVRLTCDHHQRTRNHAKYHPTRSLASDTPTIPTIPILTIPKKEEDNTSRLAPNEPTWPSPFLLIQKYNSAVCNDLPAVEKITPARLKKAREYLQLFPEESFWTEVFQEVNRSPFLRGQVKSNGHHKFKGNFDWLLTKGKDGTENVAKVFEGRYRDGP